MSNIKHINTMRKIFMLIALLGLAMTSCDKANEPIDPGKGGDEVNPENGGVKSEEEDDLNGGWPEPVVVTPAELCIDLAEGNSATFTTSEPSYFAEVWVLGESLEFSPEEILGWSVENGAILVWSSRGEKHSVPFEIGSDWYTLRQVDEVTYEVTIGDVDEPRLITIFIGSRVYGRHPARLDIAVKPKNK